MEERSYDPARSTRKSIGASPIVDYYTTLWTGGTTATTTAANTCNSYTLTTLNNQ